MTQKRPAETEAARDWDGDVAARNELDEVRPWVVWGVGPPAERAAEPERATSRPGQPGNDLARRVAEHNDPGWAKTEDAWVVILEADENEVDGWVQDDESVRGYAPYLVNLEDAQARPEIMRGVLRGDAVRRRKPKRFDTARPS